MQKVHAHEIGIAASPPSAVAVASSRQRIPSSTRAHATSVAPWSASPSISRSATPNSPPELRGPRGQLGRGRGVAGRVREVALVERDPAVLRARLERIQQPRAPLQPSARHRPGTAEVELIGGQPRRHAGRAGRIRPPPVEPVRALPSREHRIPVIQPPRRPAQPLERLGGLLDGDGRLEPLPRSLPAPRAQFAPTRDHGIGRPVVGCLAHADRIVPDHTAVRGTDTLPARIRRRWTSHATPPAGSASQ